MSGDTGVYIYRIKLEIWIGLESSFGKDSLKSKSSEILNAHNNVLKCEDGSDMSLYEYLEGLINQGHLTGDMIPCSLGTFIEEAIKRKDKKRQWRVVFSHLGED